MGLYLFSGPAFEFPTHFSDCVSDSEGEVLLDSLFGLNGADFPWLNIQNKREILLATGRAEQFLAKLCELAIKLSAKQLVIFGSSGRRTFV